MTLQNWFWILWVIWAFFGAWGYRSPEQPWARGGWTLMTLVLFFILGWGVFGAPLK